MDYDCVDILLAEVIQTEIPELTPTDKAILITLMSYMYKGASGVFKAKVDQKLICNLTGSSKSTVIGSLKKCENLGFISSKMCGNSSKVYTWLGLDTTQSCYDNLNYFNNVTELERRLNLDECHIDSLSKC